MWRLLGSVGCLVLIVLGFEGCRGRETLVEKATRQKILLLANGSEPKSLDHQITTGEPEAKIGTALIEGLVTYHPTDDTQAEPGVAESWEPFENYSRWIFHLRRHARWSNGDRVTAGDFVYSYRRMLAPGLAAEYAELLYIMQGAEAFNRGETADFSGVGVKALDDYTLEFHLIGPTPYFPLMLKHHSWHPVHPATIEKFGTYDQRVSNWARVGNFVGNGPFQLKGWKLNRYVEVERNPYYWDAARVKLNGIRFLPIENVSTEERAFRAGQLHITHDLTLEKIPFYQSTKSPYYRSDPAFITYFYRCNTKRPPLGDRRVRQALSLAIDRESLTRNVLRAGQQPAGRFTPQGVPGYEADAPLAFDPEKARQLLEEAGFPGGKGFPKMNILYNTHESHRTIAEAIQQMWRVNLGIEIGLVNQEWQVYIDTETQMDYDISRAGWVGDYLDPITFLDLMTTTNPNNKTGWSNKEYDRLIDASRKAPTMAEHFRLLAEAEGIFSREVPVIPIYWYVRNYLIRPEVKGWNPVLQDMHNYKFIDLVPQAKEGL